MSSAVEKQRHIPSPVDLGGLVNCVHDVHDVIADGMEHSEAWCWVGCCRGCNELGCDAELSSSRQEGLWVE